MGNEQNQIPDMAAFASSLSSTGFQKLPSGLIIQWGIVSGASNYTVTYPVTFPNRSLALLAVPHTTSVAGMTTQPYQFTKGSIFHLMEPDINQEIYGLPGYLSAIPSALLNESATLFRRKYYINGSHAGFIMYMTDAAQNQEDVNNLRNAMKSAKGPGNFRNLFMYSPNGKKDGLQIIPLSEVAAKDEFLNIKNVSRDDMMAAHRVPPQMMGIMPNNVGGFGDVEKASLVFVRNELMPLQKRLHELNEWVGAEVIRFDDYVLGVQE
ncbi:TPA: phage portal protein [Escherichia coli]